MDIDTFLSSKSAWLYIAFAVMGVIATTVVTPLVEKRKYQWDDLLTLGWIAFAVPTAILVARLNDWLGFSFLVGMAGKPAWLAIQAVIPVITQAIAEMFVARATKKETDIKQKETDK